MCFWFSSAFLSCMCVKLTLPDVASWFYCNSRGRCVLSSAVIVGVAHSLVTTSSRLYQVEGRGFAPVHEIVHGLLPFLKVLFLFLQEYLLQREL